MASPIQMPALSPTMKEGKITRWLKKEGDKISSGEAVAEVETDKSNLEVEAYEDGVLLKIVIAEGESAPVGSPIGFVGEKGEKVEAGGQKAAPAAAAPAKADAPAKSAEAPKPAAKPASAPAKTDGPQAIPVQMPALSPTMKEGKINRWLKKEGDTVSSGEAIAEVETDKSNLEVESYEDGVLLRIDTKDGESAPVGSPIAWIGPKGASIPQAGGAAPSAPAAKASSSEDTAEKPAAAAAPAKSAPAASSAKPAASATPSRPKSGGRLRVSPLARKMAEAKGLDLGQLDGSGPQGRIIKRDIEAAMQSGAGSKKAGKAGTAAGASLRGRPAPEEISLSGMRRVIGERMGGVKPGVPHFYLTVDIEMDAALRIRDEAKALDSKVSVNDIILKAAALALKKVPQVNTQLHGDKLMQLHTADIGVAVALEEGLITPVVRDVDQKGLAAISAEVRDLAEKARKRALKPEQYTGGSLTVSNLGMFGIDSFIAVINPPQSAILAVGTVAEKPVARDGQLVVRKMMSVTFSGDHRVIDGAVGAVYLKEFRALLEHPLRLLF